MTRTTQSLGSFYASQCGLRVFRQICRSIDPCWPDIAGARVLTVGYATPFCVELEKKSPQFILETDPTDKNENPDVLKIRENALPFPNGSFQYALVVNALEYVSDPAALLKELWRILAHNGSLICIVPNRYSLWGVQKTMPPMQGALFSGKELDRLAGENRFLTKRRNSAVFLPPAAYTHNVDILDEFISYLPLSAGAFLISEMLKQALVLSGTPKKSYKSARMTKASILSSPRS